MDWHHKTFSSDLWNRNFTLAEPPPNLKSLHCLNKELKLCSVRPATTIPHEPDQNAQVRPTTQSSESKLRSHQSRHPNVPWLLWTLLLSIGMRWMKKPYKLGLMPDPEWKWYICAKPDEKGAIQLAQKPKRTTMCVTVFKRLGQWSKGQQCVQPNG